MLRALLIMMLMLTGSAALLISLDTALQLHDQLTEGGMGAIRSLYLIVSRTQSQHVELYRAGVLVGVGVGGACLAAGLMLGLHDAAQAGRGSGSAPGDRRR